MLKNKGYNLSRWDIMFKCSVILHMMIEQFMKKVVDYGEDG